VRDRVVGSGFAGPAIAARNFPSLELRQGAVNADEVDIESRQKKYGRRSRQSNSPLSMRCCGSMLAAMRWSMEKCQKGADSVACRLRASDDFPELDAPLSRMILPGDCAAS
jgi:hypothetical protein